MMQSKKRKKTVHMKVIGITGGVGAGKSELLAYIKEHYNCQVMLADDIAHRVEEPGQKCYDELVALLGVDILKQDGAIDKSRMAERIFADRNILAQVNQIVHPAVKEYILQEMADRRREGKLDFLFIEAALLIEDGYGQILDELWYIHTDTETRRDRLKSARAYSDEKIERILREQLSEEEFRRHCKVVIDNSGSLTDAYKQIDRELEGYLCQR